MTTDVLKQTAIDLLRKKNDDLRKCIAWWKDEGDLKYLETIKEFEAVVRLNELFIERLPEWPLDREFLQKWVNELLADSLNLE